MSTITTTTNINYFSQLPSNSIIKFIQDDYANYFVYHGIRIVDHEDATLFGWCYLTIDEAIENSNSKDSGFIAEDIIDIEEDILMYNSEEINEYKVVVKTDDEPKIYVSLKQNQFEQFSRVAEWLYINYFDIGLDKIDIDYYKNNYQEFVDPTSEDELYFAYEEDIFCDKIDYDKVFV